MTPNHSRLSVRVTRTQYQILLLAAFIAAASASLIGAPYPREQLLQHGPTCLALVGLVVVSRLLVLSSLSFTLVIGFLCLHVLGARYIYTYVPYDQWSSSLFDITISDLCGFSRNHYDRLVHFAFGVLITIPLYEVVLRLARPPLWFAYLLAISLIMAGSLLYEIGEAAIALVFAHDWAERYLGQQGDPWDAHRDMGIATVGAVTAVVCMEVGRQFERKRQAQAAEPVS